ncbi:hypothetical protein BY996DRAFT_2922943 [Phakopsora pachyrhizi]|nr:hypothetical protein BY996DRAFT_2922943 [Phakopsora pachyrhizi]
MPPKKGTKAPGQKKRSSAYSTYMQTALIELKKTHPTVPHMQRFKMAAENWKNDP